MAEPKIEKLFEVFKKASASENPGKSIVDSIDELKDSDPELWTIINETRKRMLSSMNSLTLDEKMGILKQFKDEYGDKK